MLKITLLLATILIISVILSVIVYLTYKSVIKRKNKAKEAFLSICIMIKNRCNLILEMLAITEKYTNNKNKQIEEIKKLCTDILLIPDDYKNMKIKFNLDDEITNKMQNLLSSIEDCQDLQSDTIIDIALKTYNQIEKELNSGKDFLNTAINNLNDIVIKFPYSTVIKMFKISKIDF